MRRRKQARKEERMVWWQKIMGERRKDARKQGRNERKVEEMTQIY